MNVIKFERIKSVDCPNTTYTGTIHLPYNVLKDLFGQPENNSGDNKSIASWYLSLNDNTFAVIYEYKQSKAYLGDEKGLNVGDVTEWNVSGKGMNPFKKICKIINNYLENDKISLMVCNKK